MGAGVGLGLGLGLGLVIELKEELEAGGGAADEVEGGATDEMGLAVVLAAPPIPKVV